MDKGKRRLGLAILFVFAAQVALISWLGARTPDLPRDPAVSPSWRIAAPGHREWVALEDPTLFVLPHPESVSGKVWLNPPRMEVTLSKESEPPDWLRIHEKIGSSPVAQLGASFRQFISTNPPPPFQTVAIPEPRLTFPPLPPTQPLVQQSTLRAIGDLAARRLLTPVDLPAWPHTDLLTNTLVQVFVDAQGITSSWLLQPPSGSGLKDADQFALDFARRARFEPIGAPLRPSQWP